MTFKQFLSNFENSLEKESRLLDKTITRISTFDNLKPFDGEINTETKNIPLSEKPDIDWNFVLGLLFGIGYLIFAANA